MQHTATGNSSKMLRAMVGIGIACALLIVLTFEFTKPIIEKNRAEALERAIFKVLPGVEHVQAYQLDADNNFIAPQADDKDAELVYAGYAANGELVGVAIEASGQGYADILRILYGYDPKQGSL